MVESTLDIDTTHKKFLKSIFGKGALAERKKFCRVIQKTTKCGMRSQNDQIGIVVGKITSFATTLCCRKKYVYSIQNVPFFGNACGKTSCGESFTQKFEYYESVDHN